MTFWEWADRRWPSERGWVTIGTFTLAGSMLKMAEVHRELWNVELFKTLLTLVIGTAIVNMILAFHFTANKADETRADNTGKAFEALKSVAESTAAPSSVADAAADAADQVAGAAARKAYEFSDGPVPNFTSYPDEETKP